MPFLDRASSWLDSKLAASDGLSVVYLRGGASISITHAVVGQTQFAQENEGQVIATWRDRDYFIGVTDLVLDGSAVVPQEGDVIQQVLNGVTKVYEVQSTGIEPCFRFTGPDEATYRIHTKLIGAE